MPLALLTPHNTTPTTQPHLAGLRRQAMATTVRLAGRLHLLHGD